MSADREAKVWKVVERRERKWSEEREEEERKEEGKRKGVGRNRGGGGNSLIIKTVLREKKRAGCLPLPLFLSLLQCSAGFLDRSVSLHPQEG